MPLDFTKKSNDDQPSRRPPPDYGSFRMRVRLFAIVGSIMLVGMIVSRIREPGFLQLLGFKQAGIAGGPPLTKGEVANRSVDTELRAPRDHELSDLGTTLLMGDDHRATSGKEKSADNSSPDALGEHDANTSAWDRAWLDGWTGIVNKLDQQERSLFYKGLQLSRKDQSLDSDDQKAWALIVENADREWSEYRDNAKKSLDALPEAERANWEQLIEKLAESWKVRVKPALDRIGEGLMVAGEDAKSLEMLQLVLDKVALAFVEDNTLLRANETEAWFRLYEELQAAPPDVLRKRSKGPVGFLQLFDQPKLYRGQVVTVRGTARLAYHVAAAKNAGGIEGYYVFWVHPAGGPDSPFVVYSLETPPNFPPIKDKDKDRQTTSLHEDVEFTGYFFKNWAYPSKSGIHRAPLLLARMPRWEQSPDDLRKPPDTLTMFFIVIGCAIGAIMVAVYGYKQSLKAGSPKLGFKEALVRGRGEDTTTFIPPKD